MTYWGSGPADNDFAMEVVSRTVLAIVKRMLEDGERVVAAGHPEQSIVASLRCLRVISREFPTAAILHFRKKQLRRAAELFGAWARVAKIPKKHREAVLAEAQREFRLCAEMFGMPEIELDL